jgi:FkbM family methyltransferase
MAAAAIFLVLELGPRIRASRFGRCLASNDLFVFAKPFKFEVEYAGFRYFGDSRELVDQYVLIFGGFEKHISAFMRDFLIRLADPQSVFIDVGANSGTHSLFLSRFVKEVHAFEPAANVRKRFIDMVAANHITNIAVHSEGLGDRLARVPFFEEGSGDSAWGSVVRDFQTKSVAAGEIEIVPGDLKVKELNLRAIHLIKVDVEGFEKAVLAGFKATLVDNRPVVVLEFNTRGSEAFFSLLELQNMFPEKYRFIRFINGQYGRSESYQFKPLDTYESCDVVAFPEELKAQIPGL